MPGIGPINGFSIMGLATVAMSTYACCESWHAFSSLRWPATKGRVLSGGIFATGKNRSSHRAHTIRVLYEYTVDDVRFESDRIRFGGFPTPNYAIAAAEMAKLMQSPLLVYYDPARPHLSCLVPGWDELNLTYPMIVFPVGCFMLFLGLFSHS